MTPFRYAFVLTMLVIVLVACSRPASPPESAPSNVVARGVGGAAAVTWTASTDSPSAPSGAAVVQVRRDEAAAWQDATLAPDAIPSPTSGSASSWTPFQGEGDDSVTRVTVSSLTDFTAYRFRAAFTNEAGRGPWSDASPIATATMPPAWPEEDLAAGDVRFTRDDEAWTFARCRDDGSLLVTAPRADDVKDDPTLDCDDTDREVRPFEASQADARLDVTLTVRAADGRLIGVAAGEGVLQVPSDGSLTVSAAPFEAGTVVEAWREGDDRPLVLLSVDGEGVASGVVPLTGVVEQGTQELLLRGRMPAGGVAALRFAFTVLEGAGAPALLDVDIVQDDVTIDVGAETTLSLTTVFVGVGGDAVRWSSLQPDVATVDEAGVVRAVRAGTATIRVEGVHDANRFDEATIRVRGATGVTITTPEGALDLIPAGQTLALGADVQVLHGADDSVTWRSSNERIATVDGEGRVTAVSTGDFTITAASVVTPTIIDTLSLRVPASGEAAWTAQVGGPDDDMPAAVTLLPGGDAIIVGEADVIGNEMVVSASNGFAMYVTADGEDVGLSTTADFEEGVNIGFTDIEPMPDGYFAISGYAWDSEGGILDSRAVVAKLDAETGAFWGPSLLDDAPAPSLANAITPVEDFGFVVFGAVSSTDTTQASVIASAWFLYPDLETQLISRADMVLSPTGDEGDPDPANIQFGFEDGLVTDDGGVIGIGTAFNFEVDPFEFLGFISAAADQGFGEVMPFMPSSADVSSTEATAMTMTPDGTIAIVGYEDGPDSQMERTAFLHRIDSTGMSRTDALGTWADNAAPSDVAVLPNGDLVIVGQADDPLGDAEVSGELPAGFVAIVGIPDGGAPVIKRSWMVGLGSLTSVEAVAVREDGWLVLAGYTTGDLDGPSNGGWDVFVQLVAP